MKKSIVIMGIILALATQAQPSWAEATQTVLKVMNEPLSMFDWGMYRLEERLQNVLEVRFGKNRPPLVVSYDNSLNRLQIFVGGIEKFQNEQEAKRFCKAVVKYIKMDLFINVDTGDLVDERAGSAAGRYFMHLYGETQAEKAAAKEIDKLTEIGVNVVTKDMRIFFCRAPLLGTDIFFSEEEGKTKDKEEKKDEKK
jgi:hypothetical protein